MNKRLMLGLAAPLLFAAAPAGANITYTGAFDLSNGVGGDPNASVSLSITTDGVLGALVKSDIVDFDILITQGGITSTLDPSNSFVDFYNGGSNGSNSDNGHLTATTSRLNFLFDTSNTAVLFDDYHTGALFCLQNNNCTNNKGPQIQASTNGVAPTPYLAEQGYVTIGTAGDSTPAVPEPATWALMISGFGAIGGSMRRRVRRTAGKTTCIDP